MKRRAAILAFATLSFCTTSKDEYLEPEDANTRIVAAVALKNAQCGYGQFLTLPVIFPVSETALNVCVSSILASSCATWANSSPLSASCLGLPFTRKHSRDNYGF